MRILFTLFISFLFYAFLGWCFEMVHMGITTKEVVNRGFFNGPIVPIYGVGMMSIIYLLDGVKDNFFLTLVLIVLICSVLEYSTSYIMEKMFSMRWWDYEGKPLNLNGRICFETMSMFTIMALFGIYKVEPVFSQFLERQTDTFIIGLGLVLMLLFMADILFSSVVLKKFMNASEYDVRGDKTSSIRKYTLSLLKSKI